MNIETVASWNDAAKEGYNAYLEGLQACPYTDEQFAKAEAWRYGWREAQHDYMVALHDY